MHIIALRHPPPVTQGICAGRIDFPVLDPRRFLQALIVHPELTSIGAVFSSPAARCLDLARMMAEHLAVPLVMDARLQELDFGDWEGRPWNEIETEDHERFRDWADDWHKTAPPNGESVADLERRIGQFAIELKQDRALIITHAGPIRALRVLGQSISWQEAMSESVPHATPYAITLELPGVA
jgi:alpha-ribazole phosphatase